MRIRIIFLCGCAAAFFVDERSQRVNQERAPEPSTAGHSGGRLALSVDYVEDGSPP